MALVDVISKWSGTMQFAIAQTARRLRVSNTRSDDPNRYLPYNYIEVDNRANSQVVFWAINGSSATSTLSTGIFTSEHNQPNFRLVGYSIDRVYANATSISVLASTAATNVFITMGRY